MEPQAASLTSARARPQAGWNTMETPATQASPDGWDGRAQLLTLDTSQWSHAVVENAEHKVTSKELLANRRSTSEALKSDPSAEPSMVASTPLLTLSL
eukprot:284161-Amphidinium_carterae.1